MDKDLPKFITEAEIISFECFQYLEKVWISLMASLLDPNSKVQRLALQIMNEIIKLNQVYHKQLPLPHLINPQCLQRC